MGIVSDDSGMTSNVQLSLVDSIVIASFTTIAWYNVVELTILIQTFFKRRAGVYYWSLIVSTYGIFFHCLGQFLKFYHINDNGKQASDIGYTFIATTGWVAMVTGQSIVLYSRLHLVLQAQWVRWILVYIIVDGVVLHTSTAVLTFLTNCSPNPAPYVPMYSVVEKIQVFLFFVQESVISGLYIWKASVMLKKEYPAVDASDSERGKQGRKVLVNTLLMSAVIILLDIATLGLEFAGIYDIQTSYKGAVYSIKLKLEFIILNQLMNLVRGALREPSPTMTTTHTSKSRPRRPPPATSLRLSGGTAGTYNRFDDGPEEAVRMQNLGEVIKTTTTEVRVDEGYGPGLVKIVGSSTRVLSEGKGMTRNAGYV